MSAQLLLRTVAVAIAIAGAVDPGWTREVNLRHPLTIVVIEPRQPSASSASVSRLWSSVAALRTALESRFDVIATTYSPTRAASACPADGGCIVVSDGAVPTRVTAGADVIGGLLVSRPSSGAVAIARVYQPDRASAFGASRLNVWLGGTIGRSVVIRVFDEGMLVGESNATTSDGPIAVDWTPMATGLRRLRVVVAEREGTQEVERDSTDVGVQIDTEKSGLLLYEPEPSWLGTFVRRALEGDPRFAVDVRTRFGPGMIIGANRGRPLSIEALRDKRAVIVPAPEALTAEEVRLLERFAGARGGSIVLLPDRLPTGPVTGLMPAISGERRDAEAQTAGALKASEFVTFDESSAGMRVLARVGEHPVVVSHAVGRGRAIVSGALDAWRFRDAAFNRYWSSLLSDAAIATGPQLRASLARSALRPGEATRLTAEWRSMEPLPTRVIFSARLTCEDGSNAGIRLWPTGRAGVFEGSVRVPSPTTCSVVATVSEPVQLEARASLLVASDVSTITAVPGAFASAIQAHGGSVARDDRLQSLVDAAHGRLPPLRDSRESRPMRSPWWLLPFAGCLAAEWWLRRRAGLR